VKDKINNINEKEGICKLCLQQKKLKHSHITPEFMYQNIYDTSPRRFYNIKTDLNNPNNSGSKLEQKGIREYMLCGDCESLLNKYETYAAETIYGKNNISGVIVKKSKQETLNLFVFQCSGFSYSDFKIFQLSLLWRIIVSESESFPTISIDSEIVETLRVAILNQNPLNYDDFGCSMQVISVDKEKINGFIMPPASKENVTEILSIVIDGFEYNFFINSKNLPEDYKKLFLKSDGTMIILEKDLLKDNILLEKSKTILDFYNNDLIRKNKNYNTLKKIYYENSKNRIYRN